MLTVVAHAVELQRFAAQYFQFCLIFFLFVLLGLVVLFPYMTIHMTTLGMTIEEIAVISGVYPLFTIVSSYTSGVVADKMGNFKVIILVQHRAC